MLKKEVIARVLCLLLLNTSAWAQTFTEVTNPVNGSTSFLGVYNSAVAWGDYDNDGDLDLVVSGFNSVNANNVTTTQIITKLYQNNNGAFTDTGTELVGVQKGAVAWGDYDSDGDLDLIVTGEDAEFATVARLYRNDGGSFVDSGVALQGVSSSAVAWVDYNNDGFLDLAITGTSDGLPTGASTIIYRNNGQGSLENSGITNIPGFYNGSIAFGDYDNDGDADLAFMGTTDGFSTGVTTQVYRNKGNGSFENSKLAGFKAVAWGSIAWGDFDNDSDLDLLLTGWDSTQAVTKIYQNDLVNDTVVFNDIGANIAQADQGKALWGDYNSDGNLDILLTGRNDSLKKVYSLVYQGNGSGGFTVLTADTTAKTVTDAQVSSAGWADYDNDGDLDMVIAGLDSVNFDGRTILYRNQTSTFASNTPPATPTNLTVAINPAQSNTLVLNWNASSDGSTPASGLSYNLRVGLRPGELQTQSPHAHLTTGLRQIAQAGYIQGNTTWTLRNLSWGKTYYISVQAIDQSFSASGWSEEVAITIDPGINRNAFLPNTFTPNNDGTNDFFRIVTHEDVSEINFRVFDRLGKLMYQTSDINEALNFGWNGKLNGKNQPAGVYMWYVKGKFADGKTLTFNGNNSGSVVLVR
ncbi:FG-GAP-like repeat-containing protein [uncultured Microscilla sp.]|uniref:FG-GAP-like repeat-containing protein n=1 Tax=uncultured Microscilla sp. TaxID=432653 RepID=UPI002639B1CB|nr:FG-GAP-like repeat-containing protein [uncultured Microscilla sp.]